ncbi:hypothetical protein [Burkholderia anthina]|uniref:hypothetical protein n=1 Tax=Burkholderia anthina TaxID=179879 RepID=UPI00158A642F|nr:hypothetical protein [Burkholderia anthina]
MPRYQPMRNRVRLFAFALIFVASGAQTHDATNTWGRAERIAMVRRQALSESHTADRTKSATARAAYDTLKPAIDANCLPASGNGAASSHVTPPGAIAYARLLNDASVCLTAAGSSDNDLQGDADNGRCLGVLHPLIGDDMRPHAWLPSRLGTAVAANVRQCSAHCVGPLCKPTNMNVWSAYRSEAAQYTRHPACSYDARLVQLGANTCVGFDGGAYGSAHTAEDAGKLTCDARSSTSETRCPAILVLTRNQGKSTIRRFPPAEHSALSDPSTACAARSTGVDTDGMRFALRGEGRDCFGGTAHSLIEEIYVLRRGQPVLVKSNSEDF